MAERLYMTAGTDRAASTVVGSVLLHAAVIALAALYPVRYSPPAAAGTITTLSYDDPGQSPAILTMPPAANNPAELPPPVDPDPRPLVAESADVPPTDEAETLEMPSAVSPRKAGQKARPTPRSNALPGHGSIAASTGSTSAGFGHENSGEVARCNTPQPPYPYALRMARVAGSGSIRITCDGSGRVVSAIVVQSTRNRLLDENTIQFARARWTGPPNASVIVPILYQIR